MTAPNGSAMDFSLDLQIGSGGWSPATDSVCAEGTATVTPSPDTAAGLASNLQETSGGNSVICIGDAARGNGVSLTITRKGASQTATLQPVAPSDGLYNLQIQAQLATPIYSNGVFSLSQLLTPADVSPAAVFLSVDDLTPDASQRVIAHTFASASAASLLASP
jgi:hypothetical protein